MKITVKKILLFVIVIITAILYFAIDAGALNTTGQCGDNVFWKYDSSTKELVIRGTGDMDDYIWNKSPFVGSDVKNVDIKNGVTGIGEYAFALCEELVNIEIPDSVTRIGSGALFNCASLTDITIPDSVENADLFAFDGCPLTVYCSKNSYIKSYCKENRIPFVCYDWTDAEGVTKGKSGSLKWSVDKRTGLMEITGSGDMPDYNSVKAPWYECRYYITSVKLSDAITKIGNNSFNSFYRLETFTIPEGVKTVGEYAFAYCKGLKKITVPKSVTKIGQYAFAYCENLSVIDIPIKVKNISNMTFYGCKSLKEVKVYSKDCWLEETCGLSNIKIYGYKGSATEGYAKKIGAKFADIETVHSHKYKTFITKATTRKNGKVVKECTVCGNVSKTTTIYYPKTTKLSATTYTYNGKNKTPSVTVKDSKGKTLKKNTDYTVTYPKKRKLIGKYTVTVKFKGNYSGTKKLTFEIVPAKVTLSKLTAGSKQLTATWKTVSGVTGYEVVYSTSSKFSSSTTKKVTVKKAKTKKTTIKKLKKGKKYYVKVRAYKTVGKTKIYGAYSKVKTATVK